MKFSIHCCNHCQFRIVIFGHYVWLRIPKLHKDTLFYALIDEELEKVPQLREELDIDAKSNHSNIYSELAYSVIKTKLRINDKTPESQNEKNT